MEIIDRFLLWMPTLLVIAGLGQLALGAVSLSIPLVLGWKEETRRLSLLTRYVFWTYAGYILATNLAFGLLSALAPGTLLEGGLLATAVAGFIAIYWISRVVIQWVWFSRVNPHTAPLFRLAETGLNLLFLYLAAVYTAAATVNLTGGLG